MSLQHKLALAYQHPGWALTEAAARVRVRFSPTGGVRQGRVGPVRFDYDFSLGGTVRTMYAGAYATELVGLLRKILQPGDKFVDVGANIGYLSAVGAGRVGTAGRVLSFEPAPIYFS